MYIYIYLSIYIYNASAFAWMVCRGKKPSLPTYEEDEDHDRFVSESCARSVSYITDPGMTDPARANHITSGRCCLSAM